MASSVVAIAYARPAMAGPPYLTNDPGPTDQGKWEIYNFVAGEGRGSAFSGEGGFDLNYGAAKDLQLSATLPFGYSHDHSEGFRSGTGDVEVGVKYRFYNDRATGISAAVFPKATLPTSSLADHERTRLQIPFWFEKDFAGGTHVFGGVGYELNAGRGNRNFVQAAIALTHDVTDHLSAGAEITRQEADTIRGTSQTRVGVGSILRLSKHYALLFSGGPTWAEHRAGFHAYGALGLFY